MLGGRGARDRAGVVHEDVDGADVTSNSGDELVQRAAVGEVAPVRVKAAADRLDLCGNVASLLERRADADDVRAG